MTYNTRTRGGRERVVLNHICGIYGPNITYACCHRSAPQNTWVQNTWFCFDLREKQSFGSPPFFFRQLGAVPICTQEAEVSVAKRTPGPSNDVSFVPWILPNQSYAVQSEGRRLTGQGVYNTRQTRRSSVPV